MLRTVVLLVASLLSLGPAAEASLQGLQGEPPPESTERFADVPEFRFEDSQGQPLTREDLLGEPWIAVPFFVRCMGPCPSVSRDIAERLIPALEGTPIRVVSFSLDPEVDTAAELQEYADLFGADPERWLFVRSETEEQMHRFMNEGLLVPVVRDGAEEAPGLAITHGTRMPVIDSEGKVAGWYELRDPAQGEGGEDLAEAARVLANRYGLIVARARALAGLDYQWPLPARSVLPLVNASLNGVAFVLLLAGLVAIVNGRKRLHEAMMRSAFVVSAAFLSCYLYYHFAVLPISGGPTRFNGEGAAKAAYLLMLLTHVVLAVVNLPMVLRVFWLAHKEDWDRHRRLARWTLPIWLYVSLTGVLVYLVLYPFNPPPA
jgi:protein SCO1/2